MALCVAIMEPPPAPGQFRSDDSDERHRQRMIGIQDIGDSPEESFPPFAIQRERMGSQSDNETSSILPSLTAGNRDGYHEGEDTNGLTSTFPFSNTTLPFDLIPRGFSSFEPNLVHDTQDREEQTQHKQPPVQQQQLQPPKTPKEKVPDTPKTAGRSSKRKLRAEPAQIAVLKEPYPSARKPSRATKRKRGSRGSIASLAGVPQTASGAAEDEKIFMKKKDDLLVILEQPAHYERFRYEKENRSNCLGGRQDGSFPTVAVNPKHPHAEYLTNGTLINVSLVKKDIKNGLEPHWHTLEGKDGPISRKITGGRAVFPNLVVKRERQEEQQGRKVEKRLKEDTKALRLRFFADYYTSDGQRHTASAVSDIVGNDEVKIIETSHHEGFESVKQRVLMLTAKFDKNHVVLTITDRNTRLDPQMKHLLQNEWVLDQENHPKYMFKQDKVFGHHQSGVAFNMPRYWRPLDAPATVELRLVDTIIEAEDYMKAFDPVKYTYLPDQSGIPGPPTYPPSQMLQVYDVSGPDNRYQGQPYMIPTTTRAYAAPRNDDMMIVRDQSGVPIFKSAGAPTLKNEFGGSTANTPESVDYLEADKNKIRRWSSQFTRASNMQPGNTPTQVEYDTPRTSLSPPTVQDRRPSVTDTSQHYPQASHPGPYGNTFNNSNDKQTAGSNAHTYPRHSLEPPT
eukprot:m.57667 g.57667  ORF g.57667 m.57667 type:complete len:679 (-) comp11123_c0_seq3:1607-3643(-)